MSDSDSEMSSLCYESDSSVSSVEVDEIPVSEDQPLFFIDKKRSDDSGQSTQRKLLLSKQSLNSGLKPSDLYINSHEHFKRYSTRNEDGNSEDERNKSNELDLLLNKSDDVNKPKKGLDIDAIMSTDNCPAIIKKSVVTADFEKKDLVEKYETKEKNERLARKKAKANSKGSGWFDMKAPEITPELKTDLELLRMRGTLYDKNYRSHDLKVLPKFFQVGTIVAPPTEYYSNRIPKKQRKKTLTEEILADTNLMTKYKEQSALMTKQKKQKIGAYRPARVYSRKVK